MVWKLNRATGRVYEVPPFEKTGDFEALTASLELAKAAKAAGNPVVRTDNAMANETAKRGILAQAESEENQAKQEDMRADDAHRCMLATSNRDLVNFYSTKEAEHRKEADRHRDAAKSHRRAAAGL